MLLSSGKGPLTLLCRGIGYPLALLLGQMTNSGGLCLAICYVQRASLQKDVRIPEYKRYAEKIETSLRYGDSYTARTVTPNRPHIDMKSAQEGKKRRRWCHPTALHYDILKRRPAGIQEGHNSVCGSDTVWVVPPVDRTCTGMAQSPAVRLVPLRLHQTKDYPCDSTPMHTRCCLA